MKTFMLSKQWMLAYLLIWLVLHRPVEASNLVITQGPDFLVHQMAATILEEVYAQLGVSTRFKKEMLADSMLQVQQGKVDGDVGRIEGIESRYPNVIRVLSPVISFDTYAYGIDPSIRINQWSDLSDYRVGFIKGAYLFSSRLQGHSQLVYKEDVKELFGMLLNGELDVIISSRIQKQHTVFHFFKDKKIYALGQKLETTDLYHVLNKRHKALVDKVEARLRAIKETGQYDDIYHYAYESTLFMR